MAWNEPGGGNRDPWGGRGGDQGPPDLDEAFRKLQAQLSGIFGGGKGNSGAGGGKAAGGAFGLAAGLLVILYIGVGVYQVDEQERGVVFRFGAVQDEVVLPGLHWNPPIIDRVERVNVTRVQSHEHSAQMLTEDENIVEVSLTVQWVTSDPKKFVVEVRNPIISLEHATESALRHVVGGSEMDEVMTAGREAVGLEVQERLQTYLDRYNTGILVSKVNIDRTQPPNQVRDAFDDVQKAKEDEQRVINEANAVAESIVPRSRGEAQKQIERANAYRDQVIARAQGEASRFSKLLSEYEGAKGVTRDRLYIDAMESVLGSTSKIMVDVKGENLMMLPLDRLQQAGGVAMAAPREDVVQQLAEEIRNQDTRADAERGRTVR